MPNLPRIRVAPNQRALVTESGAPFVWLGDTAWELFHRLDRDEARQFLEKRAEQGFTVIQAVALAEFDGIHTPNAYGDTPLLNDDPVQPNEPYWQYVDEVIGMAAELGLYLGLLPTWGDKVTPMWGDGPVIFDERNATMYGEWIGRRYTNQTNVIWIVGGDRPPRLEGANKWRDDSPDFDATRLWRNMAEAIERATGDTALITYHPPGGHSSSAWLHDERWLDLNMIQSGHGGGHDVPVWDMVGRDYALSPIKPTLDGEPNYEDHPVNPWPTWDPANGYYRDHDVRKQAYRSILAGGCGVTYGHHAVWQFYDPAKRQPINHADRPWQEAIDRPAANQMRHLRSLFESHPLLDLVPDQWLLVSPAGEGGQHVQAARHRAGHYAIVYLPESNPVIIQLAVLAGETARAWWLDPRNGEASTIGEFATSGEQTFTPPSEGPDWVLVLDAYDHSAPRNAES